MKKVKNPYNVSKRIEELEGIQSPEKKESPAKKLKTPCGGRNVSQLKQYKGKTVSQLKHKLWGVFSKWVKYARSEDGINCTCISCRKPLKIGTIDCQAGHLYPKKGFPFLYFVEDAVWPQCSYCNGPLQGNFEEYNKNLVFKIGKKRVEWLRDNKRNEIKWVRSDLIELIEKYKLKLKEL